jgi:hypothetical protein
MWKPTRLALALTLLSSPVFLAAQAQEVPKGSYIAHPPNDAATTFELTFAADGKITVKLNSTVAVEGKYVIKGDRLDVVDQTGPMACAPDVHGTYAWKLDGKQLTLKPVDDQCTGRVRALGSNQWTRAGFPFR